jgi:uncharacterized membrane protein
MTVFFLIFIFTGISYLAAKTGINPLKDFKNNARIGTGLTFIFTGVSHFVMPETFMKLMPPFIPMPLAMVYLSGIFEILGGLGLIVSKTKNAAGYGLMLLLLAVYPANIYVAWENIQLGGFLSNAFYQWFRVILQIPLIYWVWWTVKGKNE